MEKIFRKTGKGRGDMDVIDKKNMSEEDIKLRFITPAIEQKWKSERMTMETTIAKAAAFTDGRILLAGNMTRREQGLRTDYLLYLAPNRPIAVVEAKDNTHSVSHGLQQAMDYALKLDLPFAYSSNGDGFAEHDFLTGKERHFGMNEFPTPDELERRYQEEANGGAGLTDEETRAIEEPYYSDAGTYAPRYYQRIAVERTVRAVAAGQKRLLLVMATGTGKTYVAFQTVYRLLKSGLKKKILYLADRNNLVDQSIQQDFKPLQKVIHKVNFAKDDPATISAYQVYFSLYQQLSGGETEDEEENGEDALVKLRQLFRPDFFDLVIVDECHRGSAKKDSNWRKILEYFDGATQIGMTATPKETKYTSNIDYFGEPVYKYSLKEGIEDGFLAPFKVVTITTNIGEGWRPYKGQRDDEGREIEDREYSNSDYDTKIVLKDRTRQVAREITNYLKYQKDRMAKTIVFCPTEEAALRMRDALAKENADMMQKYPDYVVRITGSDKVGKEKLDYFISVGSPTPVIATTSKLLSTGADSKMTKLIVLDEMIGSMTEFKQIIGRGTRIREQDGKTHFTVMDFRNVTHLFADPDWDGPIVIDPDYPPKKPKKSEPPVTPPVINPPPQPPTEHYISVIGEGQVDVRIIDKTVKIFDRDGKLLRVESITDYTKENIRGHYATLDNFIRQWTGGEKKQEIQALLREKGIDLDTMKKEQGMEDVDDFDFLCHVAYDAKPLTRRERAENVKKRDFLHRYGGVAREVLEKLLDTYMNLGIDEMEKPEILKLPDFAVYGTPPKITSYFGGKAEYEKAVRELETNLYG